jgi:hypothetical protein
MATPYLAALAAERMVEQHRAYGGITGGAALWCVLVDRNEKGRGGTPFGQAPYGAVPGMLDAGPQRAQPAAGRPAAQPPGPLSRPSGRPTRPGLVVRADRIPARWTPAS